MCRTPLHTDFLINLPVLKGHCQTRLTCVLKNIKGLIPDSEKRRYHTLGIHKPLAKLNKVIKSHLIIVDGLMGDLCFEEGGTPVEMDRLILGKDPVLIDSFAAELMGYAPSEIEYILLSEREGIGSSHTKAAIITEYRAELKKGITIKGLSEKITRLSRFIEAKNACSACYGGLVHAMERLYTTKNLKMQNAKIYVGQGWQSCNSSTLPEDGIGIGKCTAAFKKTLPGCPPKAIEIVDFLVNCFIQKS
ncbi:MAG: DUF362 domain-containing protein [Spirochaetota bacterium]